MRISQSYLNPWLFLQKSMQILIPKRYSHLIIKECGKWGCLGKGQIIVYKPAGVIPVDVHQAVDILQERIIITINSVVGVAAHFIKPGHCIMDLAPLFMIPRLFTNKRSKKGV